MNHSKCFIYRYSEIKEKQMEKVPKCTRQRWFQSVDEVKKVCDSETLFCFRQCYITIIDNLCMMQNSIVTLKHLHNLKEGMCVLISKHRVFNILYKLVITSFPIYIFKLCKLMKQSSVIFSFLHFVRLKSYVYVLISVFLFFLVITLFFKDRLTISLSPSQN